MDHGVHPLQVHRDDPVELLLVQLGDAQPARDAGRAHDDVEAAEGGRRLVDHARAVGHRGDVADHDVDLAEPAELATCVLGPRCVDVGDPDCGALLEEQLGGRPPDARRRTRHERGLPCQSSSHAGRCISPGRPLVQM